MPEDGRLKRRARKPQGNAPAPGRFSFADLMEREKEETMGLAQYAIIPVSDEWGVLHDGNVNGGYATKEAAFESAVAAASLAIRMGHEVHLSVPAREEGKTALAKEAS